MGLPEQAVSIVTQAILRTTVSVPADSRRWTPLVRNCETRKLRTDPVAVDDIDGRRRGNREEGSSRVSIRLTLGLENEQADA